jgi:hypothetical protein
MADRLLSRHHLYVAYPGENAANPPATAGPGNLSVYGNVERRRMPRIYEPFPMRVRGISVTGTRLQFDAVLDNICARGLYFRAREDIQTWQRLMFIVRLAPTWDVDVKAPAIAAWATVLRTDLCSGNMFGFAVGFKRHHFI